MENPYGILTLKLRPLADALLEALRQRYAPAALYCHGLRLHRNLHTGCFMPSRRQERADLDLLLLSAGGLSRGHDAQDFATAHYAGGSVNLLCHSYTAAQLALERGHAFFCRVAASGHLLHGQPRPVPVLAAPGYRAGPVRAHWPAYRLPRLHPPAKPPAGDVPGL